MPCSVVLCLFRCRAMMTEIRCINIRTYCNLYWLFSRKAYRVCSGYNSCREVVIILMTGKEPCWEHLPWVFSICGSLYPGFWKYLRCLPWMFILSLLFAFGIFIKNLKHSYIFIKNSLLAYGKKNLKIWVSRMKHELLKSTHDPTLLFWIFSYVITLNMDSKWGLSHIHVGISLI